MANNWEDNLNQIVDHHERATELQINESVSSLQSLGIPLDRDQVCSFFGTLLNRMVETCTKAQMAFLSSMNAEQSMQHNVSPNDQNISTNSKPVETAPVDEKKNDEAVQPVNDQNPLTVQTNYANIPIGQVQVEASVSREENKVIIDGVTRYGGVGQPNLKFIKVNVDCWEHVLDLLSLLDIIAMSQTCQRMRQICGHYFRENFHGIESILHRSSKPRLNMKYLPIDLDFLRFVDTIWLDDMEDFQSYSNGNLWRSLKTLDLHDVGLDENNVWTFANLKTNLETIKMAFMTIEDHSVGEFLAACPKLKCLRFHQVQFKQEARASVFQRVYPMLTDFQLTHISETFPIPLITSFLQQNSSIKNLQIGYSDLWKIQFHPSTIRLDCLTIYIDVMHIESINLAKELNALYTNDYCKTFHFVHQFNAPNYEEFMNEETSFNALEVLHTQYSDMPPNILVHFTQLKELYLRDLHGSIDSKVLEAVAINLINLERLWIECFIDQFLPFVQYSKKLKTAILEPPEIQITNCQALDLSKMNEERKMSGTKCKVQIGVPEELYLVTKWKAKKVVYDLVEITRLEKIREQFTHSELHELY